VVTTAEDKHDAYAAAEVGLIKSGTSSLEVALAGLPHVVGYRVNPITAAIVLRLVKVPFASIVNLLAVREVAPEFIQDECTPPRLAAALLHLLRNPEAAAAQRTGFAAVMGQLRPPEGLPSEAAAAAVLEMLPPG
jgi:lipid-A-disaccharide synthase